MENIPRTHEGKPSAPKNGSSPNVKRCSDFFQTSRRKFAKSKRKRRKPPHQRVQTRALGWGRAAISTVRSTIPALARANLRVMIRRLPPTMRWTTMKRTWGTAIRERLVLGRQWRCLMMLHK